eukprot:COSAG03_NODE_3961_length_1740_cov_66.195612_1_plen_53_part_10
MRTLVGAPPGGARKRPRGRGHVGLFGTAIKMCQEIEVRLTSIFSLGTHFLIKN